MDDMQCSGNETALAECHFRGWAKSDCDATEAAGVICLPIEKGSNTTIANEERASELKERLGRNLSIDLRLAGGRNNHEGRVEVGTVSQLCADVTESDRDECGQY